MPLDSALVDIDAVVLVTAHPGIDYGAIAAQSPLFVDLRGVSRPVKAFTVLGEHSGGQLQVAAGLSPFSGRGRERAFASFMAMMLSSVPRLLSESTIRA